jgi:uncharacterized protein (DUF433 family)
VAVELTYPHIVKKPDQPACLEEHPRTRVAMLVQDYLGRGWSAEEIVRQYPYVSLSEVHAALAYYHDHEEEIDAELAKEVADSRPEASVDIPPVLARMRRLKRAQTT